MQPIARFATPIHLVSYVGLAPSAARSGHSLLRWRFRPVLGLLEIVGTDVCNLPTPVLPDEYVGESVVEATQRRGVIHRSFTIYNCDIRRDEGHADDPTRMPRSLGVAVEKGTEALADLLRPYGDLTARVDEHGIVCEAGNLPVDVTSVPGGIVSRFGRQHCVQVNLIVHSTPSHARANEGNRYTGITLRPSAAHSSGRGYSNGTCYLLRARVLRSDLRDCCMRPLYRWSVYLRRCASVCSVGKAGHFVDPPSFNRPTGL